MRLVTNRVESNQVEETPDEYIIHDVPFIKPMHLSGGYVPRANIKNTAKGWHGVPVTMNHPRNTNGEPIPAAEKPNRHVGRVEDPYFKDGFVHATRLRINKANLAKLGEDAEQMRHDLKNGSAIEVSSQYLPEPLPEGEYDGQHRSNVEKIVRPDSVAILPGKKGQCSIEDGCGIKPTLAANADIRIPMRANIDFAMTDMTAEAIESFTDREWDGDGVTASLPNPSESDDAAGVLDATHVVHPTEDSERDDKSNWKFPFREGPDEPTNTRALVAIKGSRGVEGAKGLSDSMKSRVESWANDLLEKAPDDMFGSITTNAEAEFSEGDLVKWETQASPGTGRVAQVVTEPGETVTSEADVDNPPTREATEDEAVYKLDDWTGDGFNSGQVVKSESEMMGMWDAPEEVRSNASVPDSLRFDNPGEAVEKAAEMGFDEMGDLAGDEMIHTHGVADEMIFMPGPSHERLMERLDEIDAASKHMDEEEMDSASKHGEEMDSASGHMEDEDMDAAAGHPGQMKDDRLKDLGRRVAEALGLVDNDSGSESKATTGAESPTERTDQTQTMDRSEKIDYIVSNSALTESALAERCEDGIDAIYSDVAENSPDEQTGSESMTENETENEVVLTEDELDDMIAEKAREIVANQKEQTEKESLATEIVSNSAEYEDTESVLDDFPTVASLKTKKESLTGAGMPSGGMSVNDLGGDDEFDVSSGVLGGD